MTAPSYIGIGLVIAGFAVILFEGESETRAFWKETTLLAAAVSAIVIGLHIIARFR